MEIVLILIIALLLFIYFIFFSQNTDKEITIEGSSIHIGNTFHDVSGFKTYDNLCPNVLKIRYLINNYRSQTLTFNGCKINCKYWIEDYEKPIRLLKLRKKLGDEYRSTIRRLIEPFLYAQQILDMSYESDMFNTLDNYIDILGNRTNAWNLNISNTYIVSEYDKTMRYNILRIQAYDYVIAIDDDYYENSSSYELKNKNHMYDKDLNPLFNLGIIRNDKVYKLI